MVIEREPASAIIAAVSAASPSLPAGSCDDPTVKRSLTSSCGRTDFCSIRRRSPLPLGVDGKLGGAALGAGPALVIATAGAIEVSAVALSIAGGRGSFESVVTIMP